MTVQHKREWDKHVHNHSWQTFNGARRTLQRPGENFPWNPAPEGYSQPHDELAPEPQRNHYFTPSQFYCIETICALCDAVIAWAKFESPTNILAFLESVYPTEESHPDYVCIYKACSVLCTTVANGSWDRIWKKTTWFIVDSYLQLMSCAENGVILLLKINLHPTLLL